MEAKDIVSIIRSLQRPWVIVLYTSGAMVIAIIVALKLIGVAIGFIDANLAEVIVVALLTSITSVMASTATIMAFLFGERAAKAKDESKPSGT